MPRYWFRRKKSALCAMPCRVEGWLFTVGMGVLLVLIFVSIDRNQHSVSDTLIAFAPWLLILGGAYVGVLLWKTDWGKK
ncbi:MAG: hypothetical protein Q7R81_00550 [Candidatus Peregrinibacteria bacterium]|nr:hypothetical protein [Candidatus Peregrinibacteria bacterium]